MAGGNVQRHNSWYSSLAGAIRHHPLADAAAVGVIGLATYAVFSLSHGNASIPKPNLNFNTGSGQQSGQQGNPSSLDGIVTATPMATVTPEATVYPTPTPRASPTATANYAPISTPTVNPTATPIPKLFELVCDSCTDEQKTVFGRNALEDYRTVLGIYGINEKDVRLKIIADNQGYSINFFSGGKVGGAGGMGLDDLINPKYRDRGIKHETAHAINHTLFPTKNDIEPWYNTFDEGSAKYASGEVEAAKGATECFRKDDGSPLCIGGDKAILDYLISNPNQFWKGIQFSGNPGHLTGLYLYGLLEHEGLTPEKHSVAMKILAESYKSPGTLSNKAMIRTAYEKAMGKDLSTLFDKWLQPGIDRFYTTSIPTPVAR